MVKAARKQYQAGRLHGLKNRGQARGGPVVKHKVKLKKGKLGNQPLTPSMAKWTSRSKSWAFTCMDPEQSAVVGKAFRVAAKEEKSQRLDGAVPVRVAGNKIYVTWAQTVVGKTVQSWIYQDIHLQKAFGKAAKSRPLAWGPCSITESLGGAAGPDPGMPVAAANPPGTTHQGYQDLPQKFSEASLQFGEAWGVNHNGEIKHPSAILHRFGFLIVRKFVPDIVVKPARICVESHFKGVMGTLTEGYATNNFDKLAKLPTKVWEFTASKASQDAITNRQFPCCSYPIMPMGMEALSCLPKRTHRQFIELLEGIGLSVNGEGFVTHVQPEGEAHAEGVKMGWRILEIDGWTFKGWSDAWDKHQWHTQIQSKPCPSSATTKAAQKADDGALSKKRKPAAKLDKVQIKPYRPAQIKFKMMDVFSPLALEQKWSCAQNAGYMKKFGGGKMTKPQFFKDLGPLKEVQMYMRLVLKFHGLGLGCKSGGPPGTLMELGSLF